MNSIARPPSAESLSVVLPVRNAERTLVTRVVELLEVLPDLTENFEVVIVDDGSTDDTDEAANDLARLYPQVRVVRHAEPLGIEASAETGVSRAMGDVVIVHAGSQPVNASELQRMWMFRDDEELVVSRRGGLPGPIGEDVMRELTNWGQQVAGDETPPLRRADKRAVHRPHKVVASSGGSQTVPAQYFRFGKGRSRSHGHGRAER